MYPRHPSTTVTVRSCSIRPERSGITATSIARPSLDVRDRNFLEELDAVRIAAGLPRITHGRFVRYG